MQRFVRAPVLLIELGSAQVAYRVFGEGPPLVFVHGWPLSGTTFRDLVDELRGDFTCYVLDLPGAGDSPRDPSLGEMFEAFGQVVERFVDALGLDGVGLVGFDSGGTVARIAAARLGRRVSAIALTNTEIPGEHIKLVERLQRLAALPGAALAFKMLLRSKLYLRSSFGFGGAFADPELLHGEFAKASLVPLHGNVHSAMKTLRQADLDVVDRLDEIHGRITAPLLCVWGDRDPFFSLAGAKAMAERWPAGGRVEVIPGMKLFVHEEAAAQVAQWMAPFLATHAHARIASVVSA